MRKIAVINHKGGTGKTTTAVNVAAGLADRGRRVLLVDLDPQGNVAAWFGVRPEKGLYHTLHERIPPEAATVRVRPSLDLLSSDHRMARIERLLAVSEDGVRFLAKRLEPLAGYQYVIIDCLPSLNLLNEGALCYATEVIIPISMEYLALVGVRQILGKLFDIRLRLKHRVEITLVVPTFYDVRNRKSREVLDRLRSHFGTKLSEPIRVNVRLSEAAGYSQTIFEYAPMSHGAEDYWKLVRRVEYG